MRKRIEGVQEEHEETPAEMIKRKVYSNVGLDLFLVELMNKSGKRYEIR